VLQGPKKKIYSTLFAAVLFVLFLGQRYAGFMLLLAAFPLAVWMLYVFGEAVTNPDLRKCQSIRIAIWLAAVGLVIGIHFAYHITTRHKADEMVSAIENYRAQYGRYPATLDEIGIDRQQLRARLGMAYYSGKAPALLAYGVTYVPFDTYDYDFEKKAWRYRAD